MKSFFYVLALMTGMTVTATANNIQISNVSIVNNGPGKIQVQFDLSWENGWRINVAQNNYDGAWVFFKYKTANGNWTHITMTGSNNVIPAGFDVHQNNDYQKIGAVLYRDETNMGVGPVSISGIKLGVINTLPYNIDVKAFAIEMVYIPAPAIRPYFGDGDGLTESANAFHYTDNTATNGSVIPMKVDLNAYDDAELDTDGLYVYSDDTIQVSIPLGSLDPFPTFKAFWCMKHEISQAAYRDFLNCLTYDQQLTRTANSPNSAMGTGAMYSSGTYRSFIEIATAGISNTSPAIYGCDADGDNIYNESNDGEWVACGNLSWQDVAAFLDWSGLAPMSEFHFERAARGYSSAGPQPAILGEFAWGTTSINNFAQNISGSGTASETVNNASASAGNAAYMFTTAGAGPLRTGIFATPTSNRVASGAGFFGVMELSGNVEEYVISIGTVAGRSVRFVPNGNGALADNGNARLTVGGAGFWPGMEGNSTNTSVNTCSNNCEVTGMAGIVLKGGSFNDTNAELAIATRTYSNPVGRAVTRGGRGVLYLR